MIQSGKTSYFLACKYFKDKKEFRLSYGADFDKGKADRKIKLNDKIIFGRKSLIGGILCVIFSPADIIIAEGSSLYRRRFLDTTLSCQDKDYLQNLILYNKSLRQRNSALKALRTETANPADLDVWNRSLVKYGEGLTKKRLEFISIFNEIFQKTLMEVSNQRDSVSMRLELSHTDEKDAFHTLLQENNSRDLRLGYTSVGPHRHDIVFEEGNKSIRPFFSQGQKRTLVLSLRIAQFYFIKKTLQVEPILLVDDVIGDLDKTRRKIFLNFIHKCGQTILTMPTLDGIENQFLDYENSIFMYKIAHVGAEPQKISPQ